MKKNTLSIVISAYNEETKIEKCLKSAVFADEIVFVDNSSTDNTVAIAKKYTKNIYKKENNLMLNVNKNYGFTKATSDWILSLDADERITPELCEEIKSEIRNPKSEIDGYWIPRKNIIFGKWIKHAGWYPDYQLRLFRREKGKFGQKHVHEMVSIEGESAYLKEHIIHYNYESISQFIQKLDLIYAPNEADQLLSKGYIFTWIDAIRFPTKEFVSRFFARQGYKDGFHGLMLSFLMAFYHLIVVAKIWEKEKFKEINEPDFLQNVEAHLKESEKEIVYWFSNEKMRNTRNSFKRFWLKAKRKVSTIL